MYEPTYELNNKIYIKTIDNVKTFWVVLWIIGTC